MKGKGNWEEREAACLVMPLANPPALLPALPSCPPARRLSQTHLQSRNSPSAPANSIRGALAWHCPCSGALTVLQTPGNQQEAALKFQFLLYFLASFFPLGNRKGNCFGDQLSPCRSVNTLPSCLSDAAVNSCLQSH